MPRAVRALAACGLALALAARTEPAAAARLGAEPLADVDLVEEPSEALCLWYKAGHRGLPLVHISARPALHSRRLEAPGDAAVLRAALDAGGCDELRARTASVPRGDALWDSENFLVPAFLLGVVREVWWVLPGRASLADAALPEFREWLSGVAGMPPEFLEGLRREGAALHGMHRGLPVRIVALADLPEFKEPVLAGIDAEYLVSLHENPVREGMLDLLAGFVVTLRGRGLPAAGVVVSASCLDGRVPLEFGYLAGQIRDVLVEPGRFADGPPEAWRIQSRIEYLSYMAGREDAEREARRLAALDPDSPVPWYDQAQIAAHRGDAPAARRLLGEAVRRNARYRTGYQVLAGLLRERKLAEAALELLESGHAAFPDDVPLGLALADLHAERGDFERAATRLSAMAERLPAYPGVHAALASVLRAGGRPGEAEGAMDVFRRIAPAGGMRRDVLAAWDLAREPASPAGDAAAAPQAP